MAADTTETWILHLNLRDTGDTTAIGVKDMGAYMDVQYSYWWYKDGSWHHTPFYTVDDSDIYAVSTCNAHGYTFYKTPSVAVTVEIPAGAENTVMEWYVATYSSLNRGQGSNCSTKYEQKDFHDDDWFAYYLIENKPWPYFEESNW